MIAAVLAAALGGLLPLLVGGIMLFALGVVFLVTRIVKGKRVAIAELEQLRGGRPALRVDPRAVFFGVQSAGRMQARGNGLLSLLEHELLFTRLVPAKTWRIPLADIVAVSHPRAFLGKTYGRKLLQIDWTTEAGTDSAAWFVPDLGAWRAALAAAGVAIVDDEAQPARQ